MQRDGYCHLKSPVLGVDPQKLAVAISRLVKHGWHPVWVVVYDEVWCLISKLRGVLTGIVHPEIRFNWDFWAWYVDPTRSGSGWPVHRDRHSMPFDEGKPSYATVLALSQ